MTGCKGQCVRERNFVWEIVRVCKSEKESMWMLGKDSARESEAKRKLTGPSVFGTLSSEVV